MELETSDLEYEDGSAAILGAVFAETQGYHLLPAYSHCVEEDD